MSFSGHSFAFLLILLFVCPPTFAENNSEDSQESDTLASVRDGINIRMQSTAQWLDALMADETLDDKAHAKGYLRLGWLPRSADWSKTQVRFTVQLSLPNWENRLKLIIDNDADELNRLPFETETPFASNTNAEDEVNAAIQYLYESTKNIEIDNRLGVSRGQLYGRSAAKWQRQISHTLYSASAGLEYYFSDGFGQFIKLAADKQFDQQLSLNWSANLRNIESEIDTEFRSGLYLSYLPDNKRAMVMGMNVKDSFDTLRSYNLSYRYRQQFKHSWLFYEIEPFLEYREEFDYRDEVGIAVRLIGYYGQ
ncbi:hypothetical protein PULV_b0518 [Pseudoalteromonas ulvae UL12]|uniref:hypothetical protein n=1 Tax=Pseudoalteromonas ulvae TaxID=107327 RepID=UPI0019F76AD7|nr:hypothetical protein [Pseudoalteromonas ulvae]MBE0365840.1 hypothetical protein [Pseudoalteromonas ulvae UL12]